MPIAVRVGAHISREVPTISQRAFGMRQQPRFTPTGEDFPLGIRTSVLADDPITIPTKPTHVNMARLTVFKETGGKGGVVDPLQPFTSATVIKSERGWAHIGREGKVLGDVPEAHLKKLN